MELNSPSGLDSLLKNTEKSEKLGYKGPNPPLCQLDHCPGGALLCQGPRRQPCGEAAEGGAEAFDQQPRWKLMLWL